MLNADERREAARALSERLAIAKAPVALFMPLHGCNEWDRAGGPLSNPEGLAAYYDELRKTLPTNVTRTEINAHINDAAFTDAVLTQFDAWIAQGIVAKA